MSRVGKVPVDIPSGVNVVVDDLLVKVSGANGALEKSFNGDITIEVKDNKILVSPNNSSVEAKSMWGTARSIINGMVDGCLKDFVIELDVKGVGYKASVQSGFLNLSLGKSHNTKIEIPSYIKLSTPKPDQIIVSSNDKQKLGEYVALLKRQRPVEPYKGKGIKIKDEFVYRKEGKKG